MSPVAPSLATANTARVEADRLRAEHLLLVHDRILAPVDVLEAAGRAHGRPLLKLSIRQVLLAQPGWGPVKVNAVISKILSVVGGRIDRRQVTIGWLLDPRAGGRRFAAWLDATDPRKNLVSPGFPYAKRSSDV